MPGAYLTINNTPLVANELQAWIIIGVAIVSLVLIVVCLFKTMRK